MANTIDRLMVVLGIKTEGFATVRQQVKGFTDGTARDFAALRGYVGGFFTAAFAGELARSVTQLASRFADLKEESNQSLAVVQRYDFIFRKAGMSGEKFVQVLDTVMNKRKEALEKGGEASKIFQDFGISEDELRSLDDGVALFERLAQSKNRAAFVDMFGTKQAGKIMSAAADINSGVQAPSVMSDESIAALKDASQQMSDAMTMFKVAAAPLVSALAEWISTAFKFYSDPNGERAEKVGRQSRAEAMGDTLRDIIGGDSPLAAPTKAGFQTYVSRFGPIAKLLGRISPALAIEKIPKEKTKEEIQAQKLFDEIFPKGTILDRVMRGLNPFSGPEVADISDERLDQIQMEIASLMSGKKFGVKTRAGVAGAEITASEPPNSPLEYTMPSAQRDAQNRAIRAAMDQAVFKASNPMQQRDELMRQIAEDEAEAAQLERAGKFDDAAKMRLGMVGKTASLAGLMETKSPDFRSDSMAQVGGFIGGAAAGIDPVSRQLQDMVTILRDIARDIPSIRAATEQNKNRPLNQL
jgi:hypothetical protein